MPTYAMLHRETGVIHAVATETQTTLCGLPDLGMGATGERRFNSPDCHTAADSQREAT